MPSEPNEAAQAAQPDRDSLARARIRDDLDSTLIVEAAAGTGKTTMLVARMLSLVESGKTGLDRIVAVTFTDKAAGELKLRLRAELERAHGRARISEAARRNIDRAVGHLEVARIGTIHSLCSDILRENPIEARVDPLFEVEPEDQAARSFDPLFEAWYDEALRDPPEGVRRLFQRLRAELGRDEGQRSRRASRTPKGTLREAVNRRIAQRDYPCPYRRDPFDREGRIRELCGELFGLLDRMAEAPREFPTALRSVVDRAEGLRRRVNESGGGASTDDDLEADLVEIARLPGWGKPPSAPRSDRPAPSPAIAHRDAVRANLWAFQAAADADLAACLDAEIRPLVARYEEAKAASGKLDFLDLVVKTRDLLLSDPVVRADLAARIDRIFVDEFQDTDPLQAEILLLLAASDPNARGAFEAVPTPGKLFVVGDPMQSIYRFRRTDVAFYERTKERLLGFGAELLCLSRSYRGTPSVQAAVNLAFSRVMHRNPERSQAEYVPLEPSRSDIAGQPSIIALPVPHPYGASGRVTARAIDSSLPDAVAALIDNLLSRSGVRVKEGRSGLVPILPHHICILFKRLQGPTDDVSRPYARALEARRIPHVLVGGPSFYEREEVRALLAAARAIESPGDLLNVYATLRGPFFALTDDALLAYRYGMSEGGALGPLRHRAMDSARGEILHTEPALEDVASALETLHTLHVARNRRPVVETLSALLEATRAYAGIAVWPSGEHALSNVHRLLDISRRFDSRGGGSFRSFVELLDESAARGGAADTPPVEEGMLGVRMMTVHRAKGLEFPVVILGDMTAPKSRLTPSHHADPDRKLWVEPVASYLPVELQENRADALRRDAEEAVRIAYVAVTRARDLLIVPAVPEEPYPGWIDVLSPVLYGRSSRRPDSVGAEVPPRPEVVWWDLKSLELGRVPEGGLRQALFLSAEANRGGDAQGGATTPKDAAFEEGIVAHAAWAERRAEILARGATPSLQVRTVTELAEATCALVPLRDGASDSDDTPEEVEVVNLTSRAIPAVDGTRPSGPRFGTLVHAVVSSVDLDAPREAVEAMARLIGRTMGAPETEVTEAARCVHAALAHPLLRRASAREKDRDCHREVPVTRSSQPGELLEGVVDLAFREIGPAGPTWFVVDFKTDRVFGDRLRAYQIQVKLYADAIRAATSEPARGILALL